MLSLSLPNLITRMCSLKVFNEAIPTSVNMKSKIFIFSRSRSLLVDFRMTTTSFWWIPIFSAISSTIKFFGAIFALPATYIRRNRESTTIVTFRCFASAMSFYLIQIRMTFDLVHKTSSTVVNYELCAFSLTPSFSKLHASEYLVDIDSIFPCASLWTSSKWSVGVILLIHW